MGFSYGLNAVVMSNFGTMCPIWIRNIIVNAGCANKGKQLAVQGSNSQSTPQIQPLISCIAALH